MEEKDKELGIHCSHLERLNIVEIYSVSLQINKHGHEVQFQVKCFGSLIHVGKPVLILAWNAKTIWISKSNLNSIINANLTLPDIKK